MPKKTLDPPKPFEKVGRTWWDFAMEAPKERFNLIINLVISVFVLAVLVFGSLLAWNTVSLNNLAALTLQTGSKIDNLSNKFDAILLRLDK